MLEKVRIIDAGSEGKAIARVGDLVVFVPFVVPGDVVDIQVIKKKKSFLEGKAVAFHEYSAQRVDPFCEHFGLCGGCRWQNMNYEDQLFYKQKQIADAYNRIGKLDYPEIQPIRPSSLTVQYRNKLEYTFSGRRWLSQEVHEENPDFRGLGFHLPLLFDRIVDIRECHLQETLTNDIRMKARELSLGTGLPFYDARRNTGFFRSLFVRNSNQGDWMVILVVAEDRPEIVHTFLDRLGEDVPGINSLMYVINPKQNDSISDLEVVLYKGKGYLEEKMEDLTFKVGPTSFFQVNTAQALSMYQVTRDWLGFSGKELVYDLYSGAGTISAFVARQASKVVGIEYVDQAVEDARTNSILNDIKNTTFVSGDLAKVLSEDFVLEHGKPDVLITDPPRSGMHEKVINQIIRMLPEKLAYISCNPATQARDLALLKDYYTIDLVQPFDMFPHTHHVECVTGLKRRS